MQVTEIQSWRKGLIMTGKVIKNLKLYKEENPLTMTSTKMQRTEIANLRKRLIKWKFLNENKLSEKWKSISSLNKFIILYRKTYSCPSVAKKISCVDSRGAAKTQIEKWNWWMEPTFQYHNWHVCNSNSLSAQPNG